MNMSTHPQPTPVPVAVIVASIRDGRFAPVIADWFGRHVLDRDELAIDVIDLAEKPSDVGARLDAAEAFIVITPEYNHSYPGHLKTVIDAHRAEWFAKPVAFVSYGGISGGLRAVEHLRAVFTEQHAMTIRDSVSFHHAWDSFDADGRPVDGASITTATDAMLRQLLWWSRALTAARHDEPFAA